MDLWDVTKLMWRRWYVTAPMLLVTISAAIWVTSSVGPEYQATGHVAVVPPQELRPAEAGEVARINPWNQEALAHAARIRLEAANLETDMAAEGYTGSWSVDVTGFIPVLQIEVVAPTAEQALATMHRLQEIVQEEVENRQAEYGLPAGELFTTVRYDQGESVETTASRLRRALVAVVGAGTIMTAGVVLAFDAFVRWRRARHGQLTGQPVAAGAGAGDGEARPRYTFGAGAATGGTAQAAPPAPATRSPATSRPVPANGSSTPVEIPRQVSVRHAADSPLASSAPLPTSSNSEPAEHRDSESGPPDRESGRELEDATIVLPLSNAPWAGRTKSKHDWPPASGEPADSGGTGKR